MKRSFFVLMMGFGIFFALPAIMAATPVEAIKAALVPQANLVFFSDQEKAAQSPLMGQFEQFRDQVNVLQQGGLPDQLARWNELAIFAENMSKDLGVKPEDSLRTLLSINLSTWTFGQKMNFQQMDLLFANEFRMPIEKKKLRLALEENSILGGVECIVDEMEFHGVPVFSVFNPDAPADAPFTQLLVAMPCEGRVLFFGGEAAIRSALGRLASGKAAGYQEALTEMLQKAEGCDSFFLFTPTDDMRNKLTEFALQQQGTNPAMGNILGSFAKMKGIAFTVNSGETIDFVFQLHLASAEDAMLTKGMLMDTMLLPTLKMMIMQKISKVTPFQESLKSEAKDGVAQIQGSISKEDIAIFVEALKPAVDNAAPPVPMGIQAQ
jgi:hypothetical protein